MDSITNKAGFILLFGYCLAGARFYQPRQFYESDLKAIWGVITRTGKMRQRQPIYVINLTTPDQFKNII
ncbi:MAG: hypothetical protein PSV35_04585 [bacterium]|nr:hypothetical protein [bacterium]